MKDISGLVNSLNKVLKWNKARVSCFTQLLLGLFKVKTINLQEIALSFVGETKVDSNYRRLQRFFALFHIDFVQIARLIFSLYIKPGDSFYLVIDRTNWYWGKRKINVFMLGIAHEGMAIPLFWHMLPKAGSTHFKERQALINDFIKTFGTTGIKGLLGDREFASGQFFQWLNKKKIPFYIRIKEGTQVHIRTRKTRTAKKIFNQLQPKTKKEYAMTVWIFGQKVFLAGSRSERGELMIVATNQQPRNAIAIYLRRWEIESLFQGLKGRGFNFEATHLTEPARIAKLMVVLAIGFVWAHQVGEWKNKTIKPIRWKQFKTQKRPQYSFFRYGLDHIRACVFQSHVKFLQLKKAFSLFFTPLAELLR